MHFSLIICTYMRSKALKQLLDSVALQTLYPSEIIVVDGSKDNLTQDLLTNTKYKEIQYHKVSERNRGLTKQRNYGISKVAKDSEIVCFLDDDTVLNPSYFQELIGTYQSNPGAIGVGGYITNEVKWDNELIKGAKYFSLDGFTRSIGSRNVLRTKLGLQPNASPGWMPPFSHGYSVSFIPPSGKIYEVEYFMGGVSSYKIEVFKQVAFSEYFEGYGLYEDLDFCIRVSKLGKLYVNTNATLEHHHNPSGRPNLFSYGKMVVRNGWYVWRLKYPKPTFKNRLKWNSIVFLQMFLRFLNVFNSLDRMAAFTEAIGRKMGWFSLIFNKPKVER